MMENSWLHLKEPDYKFEPSSGVGLSSHPEYMRLLSLVTKPIHDLVTDDLVKWKQVESRRSNDVRYNKVSKYSTIWDFIEPPLGTHYWLHEDGDSGIGTLQEISTVEALPLDYGKLQFSVFDENKTQRYRSLYRNGPTISTGNSEKTLSTYIDPIKVYKIDGKHIVMDGSKRLLAAQLEKVPSIKAWVFHVQDGKVLNRNHFRNEAIKNGLEVPSDTKLDQDTPADAPRLTYRDYRKMSYPPVHQQLDIIQEAVAQGKKTEDLKKLLAAIKEIKGRYPK